MAPSKTCNFKTYEAQTRLLAAVIATAGPRLDFKELAKHAGNNCSPSSIDHRLRPIKQLAKLQREAVAKGEDPANLPLEKGAIQELFGESTPAGIEWQFRDIKKMAKAQKAAVAKGESPINVVNDVVGKSRSATSTPANRTSKHATAPTPSSRVSAVSSSLGASRNKRKQSAKTYNDCSNEASDDAGDSDYSAKDLELEATPSRKRGRMMDHNSNNATPRAAAPITDDHQVFSARPSVESTQAPATAASATPRAQRHDPDEVIDLSETSPEPEATAPAPRSSQAQVPAQFPAQVPAQTRTVPKVEPTNSSIALSFGEQPFVDPFKDHNGYMYDMDESIDFGRNASDDEC